jgi:hypothetical protein
MRYKRSFFLAAMLFVSLTFRSYAIDGLEPGEGFTNADLNGAYAIALSGKDENGFFAIGGTFIADGHGRIASGVLDVNKTPSPVTNLSISGTYNIEAGGRGAAELTSSAGNFNFVFVTLSHHRALVIRFDQDATASGSLDLQDSSAFSTSALAGTLVFNLTGLGPSGGPMKTVGSFKTNTSGTIIGGIQDSSDIGAISTNEAIKGGSIRMETNGRGTASINTAAGVRNFAFYVVDADRIKLVETDPLPALAGDAFRQREPIGNSFLIGSFAFTISGNNLAAGGPFVAGGVFSSDGKGTITSGTADFNRVGSIALNMGMSGTYTLDANGRGVGIINAASAGTLNLTLYPTVNGIQVMETDAGTAVSGAIFSQHADDLTDANFKGNYGLNYTGADFLVRDEVDAVALLTANGRGGATGILDINDDGSTSSGTPLIGSYSVDSTGRGSLILQSPARHQNAGIYLVNRNDALFIDLDPALVAVGIIERHRQGPD